MATILGISVAQALFSLAVVLLSACVVAMTIRFNRINHGHESRIAALEQEVNDLKNEVEVLAKSSFGVGKRVLDHEKRLHQMSTFTRRQPSSDSLSSAGTQFPYQPQPQPPSKQSESAPLSEINEEWSGYQQVAALVKEKDQMESSELSEGEASLLEMIRNKRSNGMEMS